MENLSSSPTPLAYSPDTAAKLLGIGRSAMYAALKDGTIRKIKLGRRTLIPATELQRFLDGANP